MSGGWQPGCVGGDRAQGGDEGADGGLEEVETEALEETKTLWADGGPETLKAETKETVMSWRI